MYLLSRLRANKRERYCNRAGAYRQAKKTLGAGSVVRRPTPSAGVGAKALESVGMFEHGLQPAKAWLKPVLQRSLAAPGFLFGVLTFGLHLIKRLLQAPNQFARVEVSHLLLKNGPIRVREQEGRV
jgi:hypothetical protein